MNRKENPINCSPQKFFPRVFIFVAVAFGCCAVLTLSSCSKKASTAIVGKWQVQGSKERVEFRKDGTVTSSQHPEANGKYTFTDGSHMTLQINTGDTNDPEISASCEVQIHGDQMDLNMTITGEGQQKAHFTRLKIEEKLN